MSVFFMSVDWCRMEVKPKWFWQKAKVVDVPSAVSLIEAGQDVDVVKWEILVSKDGKIDTQKIRDILRGKRATVYLVDGVGSLYGWGEELLPCGYFLSMPEPYDGREFAEAADVRSVKAMTWWMGLATGKLDRSANKAGFKTSHLVTLVHDACAVGIASAFSNMLSKCELKQVDGIVMLTMAQGVYDEMEDFLGYLGGDVVSEKNEKFIRVVANPMINKLLKLS